MLTILRRVSRVRDCKDWVIYLGAARSTRYYAVRKILRNEHRWPIYRILENGEMVEGGLLTSLYPNHWCSFADRIEPDKWVSSEETRCLRVLHAFGTMIGNNDMHF